MQTRFTITCLFDEMKSDAGGIVAAPRGGMVLADSRTIHKRVTKRHRNFLK
jgi:hypothetical protein